MKQFIKNSILIIALLISMQIFGQNTQMKYWYCGTGAFDMSQNNTTTLYPNLGVPGPPNIWHKNASNGIYDAAGGIIFYISNMSVYDKNGALITTLWGIEDQTASVECTVVPVPGNCEKYYIIYSLVSTNINFNWTGLYCATIEIINNLPTNINSFTIHRPGNLTNGINKCGFAVSNSINSKGEKYLYMVYGNSMFDPNNNGKVKRFLITNSGITLQATIMDGNVSSQNIKYDPLEVDLSHDGTKLAWGTSNSSQQVYCVNLSQGNYVSHNVYSKTAGSYHTGVEFSADSKRLFFTDEFSSSQVKYIDLNSNTINNVPGTSTSISYGYFDGQIELSYDGKLIVAVGNGLAGFSIDPYNLTINEKMLGDINSYDGHPFGLLPDQIDGYNYDYDERMKNCCSEGYDYIVDYGTGISNSATWTEASNPFAAGQYIISMRDGFEIGAGVQVTIQNMKFEFGPYAKVIIHPGGRLILDGTIFTNTSCGQLWKGIEVWGDKTQRQDVWNAGMNVYQGQIIVKNASTISFAKTAIKAIKENPNGTYDMNYAGGIIQAYGNSLFNDNLIAIWIGEYNNFKLSATPPIYKYNFLPNRSLIYDCQFKTDIDFVGFKWYIELVRGSGINILGNTFGAFQERVDPFGIGIISNDFPMNIDQLCASQTIPCSQFQPNTFNRLGYGIKVENTQSTVKININNNEFVGCYRGIFLSNTTSANVLQNSFQIPEYLSIAQDMPYGLYILGGKAFKVEENEFTGNDDGLAARGIVVTSTGANNNEIYHNIFNNLNAGIQTEYVNRGQNKKAKTGLGLFCNTFDNPAMDIWNTGKSQFPNANVGILEYHQISNNGTYLPSGNQFSSDAAHLMFDYDFSNWDAKFLTYVHEGNSGALRYKPEYNMNSIGLAYLPSPANRCPSKIVSPSPIDQLYDNRNTARIAFNSSSLIRDIWVDGGQQGLGQEIETTEPWDVYLQFNELMSISPYVSEDALIAMINNPAFNSLMVKLVCVANPQASHSDPIMDLLRNRIPIMPQSYIEDIENASDDYSPLEQLEGNVSADFQLMSYYDNLIKDNYRSDTINERASDSLIAYISRLTGLTDRYELASTYLEYGQFSNMTSVLENIPGEIELNEVENVEYQNNLFTFAIAMDIMENGLSSGSLTSTQISDLETIMQQEEIYDKSMALGLLKWNNPDYNYNEIILNPERPSARKPKPSTATISKEKILEVFPNPTHDYFTLKYTSEVNEKDELKVLLQDMAGKTVLEKVLVKNSNEELIDIQSLKPGVYSVILYSNSKAIANEKLTVIK